METWVFYKILHPENFHRKIGKKVSPEPGTRPLFGLSK